MKLKNLLMLLTFFLFVSQSVFSQEKVSNESFLKGKFRYCDRSNAVIVFNGKKMVESFVTAENRTVTIYSKVKWITDSKYIVTVKKVEGETVIKRGDQLFVKVMGVDSNEIRIHYSYNKIISGDECFRKVK